MRFLLIILIFPLILHSDENRLSESYSLFSELAIVEEVNRKINDRLPFIYNYVMLGGYFNMPSSRMNPAGTIAFGGGTISPYSNYGLNFQLFSHVELSANYRVYNGVIEPTFGHCGFGDDADRIGNAKITFNLPGDTYPFIPNIAVGAEDFFGSGRFNSKYIVFTKEFLDQNFEISMGWGHGRIKGLFGGLAWSPFRKTDIKFLKDISFAAEYDAINYKKHPKEHPEGRDVGSRINGGVVYQIQDLLQLSVSSLRGKKVAAFLSMHYPLGTTEGFLPKVDEPPVYTSPLDNEPLGVRRPEKEFARDLAFALLEQGLDLYTVYLSYDERGQKVIWMKIINNRYWRASEVKKRIEHVLAYLIPDNIFSVTVVIEADGLPTHQYRFTKEMLQWYLQREINADELDLLSPMKEATSPPDPYERLLLFQRKKSIWTMTFRPRLLTYFGSTTGKFKYAFGAVVSPEGYLWDEIYYNLSVSYNIKSSNADMGDCDVLNPSQIINVRTDTIRYFQSNTVQLEQAFLQKSWNLPRSWYTRVAAGYFEPAYGGVGAELLYYPVNSNWAIGFESAVIAKRNYKGLGFTTKVRKFKGCKATYTDFLGFQYFFDFYFVYPELQMDFKVMAGQFLAKDKGVRLDVGRYFDNGVRVGIWYTATDGHDVVNGSTYHDKGAMISVPLDFFLRKSSRTFITYAMSAWLRDVGAISASGNGLYDILFEERYY
jgi:Exopolysaccharide biosynthesis protein YbjH